MGKISLSRIFTVFAKIGTFTIGGGYMMVPAIQAEMSNQGWISDDELPDIVAIAQSAPGLLTVNMAIFAGYKLRGVKGSIAATLGCITPPFIIILILAMAASGIKDNSIVERLFNGVRPASVAIILAYMLKLGRKSCKSWWQWAIAAAALFLVAFLKVSPIYVLLSLIIFAVALEWFIEKRAQK